MKGGKTWGSGHLSADEQVSCVPGHAGEKERYNRSEQQSCHGI